MKRKEFKQMFIDELKKLGRDVSDNLRIESALGKLIRHMRNRDGGTSWSEEDIQNAICFWNEYKQQDTFNREIYRTTH